MDQSESSREGRLSALIPFFVFIAIYFSAALFLDDFYAVPVLVIFLLAAFTGFLQFRKIPFSQKIQHFSAGAGDENIILMILIFLLAGAFGQLGNNIGAVESVVNFGLTFISPNLLVVGLFIIGSLISLSLGTSVGTIAALAPIAVGLDSSIEGILPAALAAIIGGAMFGDNLSFISDTTIAASRTQNIAMIEKFKVNFRIVLPAAIITVILYAFAAAPTGEIAAPGEFDLLKILPYIVVLVIALLGVHVIWTLVTGILLSLLIGFWYQSFNVMGALQSVNTGMTAMFELSMICLVIGGIVGIIRLHGGIDYVLSLFRRRVKSAREAEYGIALLTAVINFCIANNTITIVAAGPLAKEIADANGVDRRRSASIMDTISCAVQGSIPYGAQILTALAIASYAVTPWQILSYLYYPLLIGISSLLAIAWKYRK